MKVLRLGSLLLSASTTVLLTAPASAQVGTGGSRAAQRRSTAAVPIAVEASPGTHDIWSVDDRTKGSTLALDGVQFLAIQLPGYALKDRLRLDMPNVPRGASGPERIRLPKGGSVYRVSRAGSTRLLHVRPDGSVATVLDTPGIVEQIHSSGDGSYLLAATGVAAGGDVFRIDLGTGASLTLTDALAPLGVSGDSLRVSADGAWFIAGSTLFAASAANGWSASAAPLSVSSKESLDRDLILAASGDRVAVISEEEDDLRRLHVVYADGTSLPITTTGAPIAEVGYDEAFGPWVAISPDGETIAYKTTDYSGDELFLARVPDATTRHLTREPEFPAYLDNVGVFGFLTKHILCFFAGDVTISGVDAEELLAAAEMYQANFTDPDAIAYFNVTHTNGQLAPPFTAPGTMRVSEAYLDPLAERFLLIGESEDEEDEDLTCFRLDGQSAAGEPNFMTLLSVLDDEPTLAASGGSVLVISQSDLEDSDDEDFEELHVLPPLSDAAPGLELLLHASDHARVDRITSSRNGERAAFVFTDEAGREVAYYVFVPEAVATPLFQPGASSAVSAAMAFSTSGDLYLGVGPIPSTLAFFAFDLHLNGQALNVPLGSGFPLEF